MRTSHRQGLPFQMMFWIVLLANIGILVNTLDYLTQRPFPGAELFESQQWRIFLIITEVSELFTQFQRLIVCLEMAMVLSDTAAEIEAVDLERCDDFELGKLCRTTDNNCAFLSEKLCLPLTLMHVDYFVHVMTEIPVAIAFGDLSPYSLYYYFSGVKKCVELLMVVNAGEIFMMATKRLARKVRKRGRASKDPTRDFQLFTKHEHSISFGLGNRLTYRSCSRFLGLSWGFTLTVLQSSFDTEKSICP